MSIRQTSRIDAILQRANGIVATRGGEGECYAVYRPNPLSPPTGILDGSPVSALAAALERTTKRDDIENELFDLIFFKATFYNRNSTLGDIMVNARTGEALCYAQRRPSHDSIWVRCEARLTIKRPVDVAERQTDSAPAPNPAAPRLVSYNGAQRESGDDEPSADVLTLSAGVYAFTPQASSPIPAVVPIGIQPTSRARPSHAEKLPTSTSIERFVGYIPPGILIRDNDELESVDGSDIGYSVDQVYSSGKVGTVGTICLLTKIGV